MGYITALIASVLTLFYVQLSLHVIRLRKLHQVSVGTGGVEVLERAIRAHGNFAEYVPLSLVLMALLEINGAPSLLVAALGACLVMGRYLHAKGMRDSDHGMPARVTGMRWTFFALALLALSNLMWIGYLLIQSARFATSVSIH